MEVFLCMKIARCTANKGKAARRLFQHPAAIQITPARHSALGLGLNIPDDLRNQLAGHIGQAHVAPVEVIRHPLVVHAQQVKQRGVDVMVGQLLIGSLVADFVAGADGWPPWIPAPAMKMVMAPGL